MSSRFSLEFCVPTVGDHVVTGREKSLKDHQMKLFHSNINTYTATDRLRELLNLAMSSTEYSCMNYCFITLETNRRYNRLRNSR